MGRREKNCMNNNNNKYYSLFDNTLLNFIHKMLRSKKLLK